MQTIDRKALTYESNPGTSCCKATVLTTAPVVNCSLSAHTVYLFQHKGRDVVGCHQSAQGVHGALWCCNNNEEELEHYLNATELEGQDGGVLGFKCYTYSNK